MKICIIGLGYIGLPTAAMFAANKIHVIGVDKKNQVVETVNKGKIHIEEPGLAKIISKVVKEGFLKAKNKPEKADVFIISVPTPNNNDEYLSCDLTYVKQAVEDILPLVEKGNTVIVESTIAPRTLDDEIKPLFERANLKIGTDIYLAHCPERVLPGNILYEIVNNTRIVGGVTKKCADKAADVYAMISKGNIIKTEAKTAEMSKLVENTFRDINIAYANELAKVCNELNINVFDVINLANMHPRVNIHMPGPGVGGHCLAVDPYFIYAKAPHTANLIKLSRDINCSMPSFVVDNVNKILKNNKKSKIGILGVTYKPNVDDLRESPALKIIDNLIKQGYQVKIHDPHVKDDNYVTIEECLKDVDMILCLVAHDEFKDLDLSSCKKSTIFFDTTGGITNIKNIEYVNYGNLYIYDKN